MYSGFLNVSTVGIIIALSSLGIGCKSRDFNSQNSASEAKSTEESSKIETLGNGSFRFTCNDGSKEERNKYSIMDDKLCVGKGFGTPITAVAPIDPIEPKHTPDMPANPGIDAKCMLQVMDYYMTQDDATELCRNVTLRAASCAFTALAYKMESKDVLALCKGTNSYAPGECASMLMKFNIGSSEALDFCAGATDSGAGRCVSMALNYQVTPSDALMLCKGALTSGPGACAAKARLNGLTSAEAVMVCK